MPWRCARTKLSRRTSGFRKSEIRPRVSWRVCFALIRRFACGQGPVPGHNACDPHSVRSCDLRGTRPLRRPDRPAGRRPGDRIRHCGDAVGAGRRTGSAGATADAPPSPGPAAPIGRPLRPLRNRARHKKRAAPAASVSPRVTSWLDRASVTPAVAPKASAVASVTADPVIDFIRQFVGNGTPDNPNAPGSCSATATPGTRRPARRATAAAAGAG